MRRERWGQLLVVLGLVAVVASAFVVGAARQLRHTDVVQRATPDLLVVTTVHQAVAAELAEALDVAFPGLPISDDQRAFAVERMLDNAELVDEVERAVVPAHRAWLDGSPLLLELDPRITTQVAIAGIRDANPSLVDELPSGRLVEPGPIAIPTSISVDTVDRTQRGALVALLVGLVAVIVGGAIRTRRHRTLKPVARAVVSFGLLLAASVLVLPWSAFNRIDDRLQVMGALLVPMRTPLLVVSVALVLVGSWIHAIADRLAAHLAWSLGGDRRRRKASAPARSGGMAPLATRKAGRHREEAIDAFFEPSEPQPSHRVTMVVTVDDEADDRTAAPAGEAVPAGGVASAGEPGADDDPGIEEEAVPEGGTPPTPEEERAATLAAERREALERIDGTRSRYRTHLPR